jgi:uncharacterized coiled-coil protein SlyX
MNKMIAHQDYLAENMDMMIDHQDYLAESANKMIAHQDYLAENMDKMIDHQDYLAENLDDTIGYQKYVAEMLDKSIDYSNMLAEEANKSIAHQDYLAENMNKMIAHQNHIVEESNKLIDYGNYLAESMNGKFGYPVNGNGSQRRVNESKVESKFDSKQYQIELGSKLDNLISTVKTNYAEAKEREVAALEESRNKINSTDFNLINYMPARLQESWMRLSDERKKEILAEAKMFIIKEEASAVYFWNTRDLREKRIETVKIEENVVPNENKELVNESVLAEDSYKMMAERIKYNMRRY